MKRVFEGVSILLLLAGLGSAASAQVRITEFAYNGVEFIEFTNVGEETVDLDGWSFDDDSVEPGTVDLSAAGVLAPGEAVILAEISAAAFRTRFDLCDEQKVIGGNATNLGRNDSIVLFDADGAIVDRLDFGDQTFPGSVRTDEASAWVSAAGLGANDIHEWTLSEVGDQEDSHPGQGFPASPGRSTLAKVLFEACPDPAKGRMRLTEYMYQGANDEFMEFTNVGGGSIDMSGWSYSDSARLPGHVDLSSYGLVQPGESVILAEAGAEAFRTAWSLCAGQKIQGGLTVNLARGDEINLYDAFGRRIDRLTYNDQTLGGPRTQNVSAWVSAAGLGANAPTQWTLSVLDDDEDSVASSGGDLGSPGRSTRATVAFDPCVVPPEAPRIGADPEASSPYLAINAEGGSLLSGVIGDPTDPAATEGIAFILADDDSDPADLTVTASSDNPAVVDADGLFLEGGGLSRHLRIVPHGVGYATVTVRVEDETAGSAQYVLSYAASAASATPELTRFHTGASDASTVQAVDADLMLVADDEDQVLRLYARDFSGLPLAGFDFTSELGLDPAFPAEVDLESSARSGDRIYWAGSHGNSNSGNVRPNRWRVFATDLSVDEAGIALSYVDRYDHLRPDLIVWDEADGHGLGAGALGFAAAAAEGVEADTPEGFNIEGLALTADGGGLLGFRAPLRDGLALLVPVLDFEELVVDGEPGSRPVGSASFGAPIRLDLGGRAIRGLETTPDGELLVLAGPAAASTDIAPANFRLFLWSGDAEDAARELPVALSSNLAQGSFESILSVGAGLDGADGGEVELLVDNGTADFYGDGSEAKSLPDPLAKFRSEVFTIRERSVFADGFESP